VLEKTNNVVLLMVGDGDLKEDAMQLAKELKLGDNIIFQPFRSDIPDLLHAIDIYCLPSLWEGFPIGILEAMAMKKAVLASPVDGTKELVEHNKTGILVEPGKPEELADAILLLHENIELRQKLAYQAYTYVKTNFGLERLVNEVQGVYSQLV
jgi:glycosyltransferase involved in cell wall biosynthesis